MKVHARPASGKVVLSTTCEGCSDGHHDVLRFCPSCGRSPLDKRNLRAGISGTDPVLDAVLGVRLVSVIEAATVKP